MTVARLFVFLSFVTLRANAVCPREGDAAGLPLIVLTDAYAESTVADADVRAALASVRSAPYGSAGVVLHRAGGLAAGVCTRRTKDTLTPYLGCSAVVNERLAACEIPRYKLLVLSRQAFTSRGSVTLPGENGAAFVSTRGPGWERDLLHELAHTFGLRDERALLSSKARGVAATPGPNCAATEAEARRRWGDLTGSALYKGCSGHTTWLRPHDETIMGSPRMTASWGASNVRYLEAAVRCCFTADRAGCAEMARRHPELGACVQR